MEASMRHAKHIAQQLSHCSEIYIIQIALKELGIFSGDEGFHYAKYSVGMLIENPCARLKNGVYLAAGNSVTPSAGDQQVEQAIRGAIKRAWNNRDEKKWRCYFPIGKPGRTQCPSNKEFLYAIVDFVILCRAFREEADYAEK